MNLEREGMGSAPVARSIVGSSEVSEHVHDRCRLVSIFLACSLLVRSRAADPR